jgi:beta-carotene 3-hydroxylase
VVALAEIQKKYVEASAFANGFAHIETWMTGELTCCADRNGAREMGLLTNIAIVVTVVVAMEFVAQFVHKHIMHGWGWAWHQSHHVPHQNSLERNDLYAVVFAVPSILLIYLGTSYEHPVMWVGVGMTIYGILYFCVHDGLVHKRWPFRTAPKGKYLIRLVQAHRLHHAVHTREGCVSFGFLFAPSPKKLKEELKEIHGGSFDAEAAQGNNEAARSLR